MRKIEEKGINLRVLGGDDAPTPPPRVFITQLAFQKIKCFVDICKYEINGLGIVERKGNNFTVEDVFLLKQFTDSSGAHVEIDPKALNMFIYEFVSKGEDASKIKFQWHSHVYMPASFSFEDVDTIGGYMNDYMISLVINKYGEYKCRLDLFEPFKLSLETSLFVKIPCLAESLVQQCKKNMEQNVEVIKLPLLGISVTGRAETNIGDLNEIPVDAEDIVEEEGE